MLEFGDVYSCLICKENLALAMFGPVPARRVKVTTAPRRCRRRRRGIRGDRRWRSTRRAIRSGPRWGIRRLRQQPVDAPLQPPEACFLAGNGERTPAVYLEERHVNRSVPYPTREVMAKAADARARRSVTPAANLTWRTTASLFSTLIIASLRSFVRACSSSKSPSAASLSSAW